jgi:DNA-binding transcriptional regulator YiaG
MTPEEFVAVRKRSGLTQAAFADLIGYHEKSMTRFETGTRPIPARLKRMLSVLFPGLVRQRKGVELRRVVGESARRPE